MSNTSTSMVSKSITAFFTLLLYEIVEEIIENCIAYAISNTLFILFTKIVSIMLIISLTQSAKIVLKKILYSVVKGITYREGVDKMEKLKTFFTKIGLAIKSAVKYVCISNPKTSLATLIAGCLSASFGLIVDVADVMQFLNFPEVTVFGIEIIPYILAIIAFVFINMFGINYGRESNAEADARKSVERKQKADKEKMKIEKQKEDAFEKEAEALANQIMANEEKERIEAEKKARLEQRAKEILEKRKTEQSNTNGNISLS